MPFGIPYVSQKRNRYIERSLQKIGIQAIQAFRCRRHLHSLGSPALSGFFFLVGTFRSGLAFRFGAARAGPVTASLALSLHVGATCTGLAAASPAGSGARLTPGTPGAGFAGSSSRGIAGHCHPCAGDQGGYTEARQKLLDFLDVHLALHFSAFYDTIRG